jgi:hypothetical protein
VCNICYILFMPGTPQVRLGHPRRSPAVASRLDLDGQELPLRKLAEKLSHLNGEFGGLQGLDAGLTEAVDAILARANHQDPLADLDAPLSSESAAREVALAEAQAAERRQALLRGTVSAGEAARLTRRSRQSLERFRRQGRVIALRQGNQWRYPRWQFDPDQSGGLVRGIAESAAALRLSPAGTAYWFVRRHPRLRAAPGRLLRQGRIDAVRRAAQEDGEAL